MIIQLLYWKLIVCFLTFLILYLLIINLLNIEVDLNMKDKSPEEVVSDINMNLKDQGFINALELFSKIEDNSYYDEFESLDMYKSHIYFRNTTQNKSIADELHSSELIIENENKDFRETLLGIFDIRKFPFIKVEYEELEKSCRKIVLKIQSLIDFDLINPTIEPIILDKSRNYIVYEFRHFPSDKKYIDLTLKFKESSSEDGIFNENELLELKIKTFQPIALEKLINENEFGNEVENLLEKFKKEAKSDFRVLMVGKSGAGKSSYFNILLSSFSDRFEIYNISGNFNRFTLTKDVKKKKINNYPLVLYDMFGLSNSINLFFLETLLIISGYLSHGYTEGDLLKLMNNSIQDDLNQYLNKINDLRTDISKSGSHIDIITSETIKIYETIKVKGSLSYNLEPIHSILFVLPFHHIKDEMHLADIKCIIKIIQECKDTTHINPIILLTNVDYIINNFRYDEGYLMYENEDIKKGISFAASQLNLDIDCFVPFYGKSIADKIPDWQKFSSLLPIYNAFKGSSKRYEQINNYKK